MSSSLSRASRATTTRAGRNSRDRAGSPSGKPAVTVPGATPAPASDWLMAWCWSGSKGWPCGSSHGQAVVAGHLEQLPAGSAPGRRAAGRCRRRPPAGPRPGCPAPAATPTAGVRWRTCAPRPRRAPGACAGCPARRARAAPLRFRPTTVARSWSSFATAAPRVSLTGAASRPVVALGGGLVVHCRILPWLHPRARGPRPPLWGRRFRIQGLAEQVAPWSAPSG